MEGVIEFARGPLFRFSLAVAILGLARHAVLSLVGLVRVRARAGDKRLAVGQVLWRTITWLNPVRYFAGSRRFYSVTSVVFHVGLILVPIFFLGHIKLWQRGIGLAWPGLPGAAADALAIVTAATGLLLLAGRAWSKASRRTSRAQDWILPPLIVLAFASGYLVAHPGSHPLDPRTTTLVHVLTGDLLLVLTPFTKIAHCVMLPFSQFVAEMAWRLVPGAGRDVVKTIGKEGQPI